MNRLFTLIIVCLVFFSCTSNEIGSMKDVHTDAIWFDYRITGEEDKEDVTIILQYRFGGENGTTLVLDEPASVSLDGRVIKADSSKMSGAFYEVIKPVNEFSGKHKIVFTDLNKKTYEEEFEFIPVSLKAEVPAVVKRGDLIFELDGLKPVDYIRVVITDTLFESPSINRLDMVENGRLLISSAELASLVNGPISMEIIKEDERPVKNGTKEGGRISINYGLKREFEMRD